ncbi:BspA family leucine-rich repeat surface protein [Chryseobacterium luquanense]|uniref:BspA family leucine-rich repeat surface protein n=1 Tax=Chryseobacterium luquanense TaxID=2983766 RepID=A0ABT3Y469_9FLAO|nr:BspA family leucine-rich repeat surface protein [Chryseobacterium luquanense]MCX8532940.1 BspA family leucine-rich repeat surface protein [Chryseobacterium luquanense]
MLKKISVSILLIFLCQFFKAQEEFITVWKPSITQTSPLVSGAPSSDTQIWLPLRGNNFTIYWEEIGYPQHHSTLTNVTSAYQILLDFNEPQNPNGATYRLKITNGNGNFHSIRFADSILFPNGTGLIGDSDKLLTIEQWGTTPWSTMTQAFSMCRNMDITATDIPNLSNITSFQNTFVMCNNLVGNSTMVNWDISNVTNLILTFSGCFLFNQPIGSWNTSNVTSMSNTFSQTTSFNQPLSNWNTSKVENTAAMFLNATSFNQPIENWDMSKNKNMEFMFYGTNFNQPLANWNTSQVTNMAYMFKNTSLFNQNIENWNTNNLVNAEFMFENATSFNQNLGNWNLPLLSTAMFMLNNTGLDCLNYSRTIRGWSLNSTTPNNIYLGNVSPSTYASDIIPDRNNLLAKGWIFQGDTLGSCSVLSTSETNAKNQLTIYPNPVTDFIYIKNLNVSNKTYKIIDTSGRIFDQNTLKENIDVRNIIPGNYIFQIITNDKIQSYKFIKK